MDKRLTDQLSRKIAKLLRQIEELEKSDAVSRQAEKRIRESENKYRSLFENATDAIYLIDTETQKIVDCNLKASKTIGYTVKELQSMKIGDLHPPEEQEVVSKIFGKIAEKGSLSGISGINQISKDNELIPIEINATTIDINGRKHCLGLFRDIKERKNAEEILKHEKSKLTSILDALPDGVYIVDQQFNIQYMNPVIKKKFGSLSGQKCFEYFHKRSSECPFCKKSDVTKGKTVRWEWSSPESSRTYDIIDSPLNNPDGSISKLQISRDITDRKQMEEALKKSEKQYRDLVDNSLVGIYRTNINGDILYANDELCRIAGFDTPKEIMSQNVLSRYRNKRDRKELLRKLKHKGYVRNFEVELVKKNGETAVALLSAFLEGNVISGMIMNITERKKMLERLQSAYITDELTGLFNKRGFLTLTEQHRKLTKRKKTGITILYLLMKGLKEINNKYGNAAGDSAIVDVSKILITTFRESDIIARIAGSEFAVLITDFSESQEAAIISHLNQKITSYNNTELHNYKLELDTQIVHYEHDRPLPIEQLLNEASRLIASGKKHERRSQKRFTAHERLCAVLRSSVKFDIKDISLGGMCIKSPRRLNKNSIYQVKIVSHDSDEEVKPKAAVVWSYSKGNGTAGAETYETGLSFREMSKVMKSSLEKIISGLPA